MLLREIREIQRRCAGLGMLDAEAEELERRVVALPGAGTGTTTLTTAEVRILAYLPTHLSFREIGERQFISRNTVKTHALSIYRKLGASSRSDAVRRAQEIGLIEG
jgi:LuxR family maltose regulon positive regulatory protein